MITLFSYPDLFGVADNNPFGLKVYAFLRLCRLSFRHEHILDTASAPRGQLPYLADGDLVIGDSDAIISHLIARYALTIEDALAPDERDLGLLVRRLLDDLYWVMSYSRWKDDQFWPLFQAALRATHPDIPAEALEKARAYNFNRYHFQGIGRYEPPAAYARGLADLQTLAHLVPAEGYMFGDSPTSTDAAIYGSIANIYFYEIDTPLRTFVRAQPNLVRHCTAVHAAIAN